MLKLKKLLQNPGIKLWITVWSVTAVATSFTALDAALFTWMVETGQIALGSALLCFALSNFFLISYIYSFLIVMICAAVFLHPDSPLTTHE